MDIKKERIGFFGGTFDPIHLGHLILAEQALLQDSLSHVYFIPSKQSPYQDKIPCAKAEHRYQMCSLAIHTNPLFSVLNNELNRTTKYSYTVDTLKEIQNQFPPDQFSFFFIVGADTIASFANWKSPDYLLEHAHFLVGTRPSLQPILENTLETLFTEFPSAKNKIKLFSMLNIEISSTLIRKRIQSNISIQYLVPPIVQSYIVTNHLYLEA